MILKNMDLFNTISRLYHLQSQYLKIAESEEDAETLEIYEADMHRLFGRLEDRLDEYFTAKAKGQDCQEMMEG